jgi:hypothetical protein
VSARETPNPNAYKYTVNAKVVARGSLSFNAASEARGNALGEALFAIPGVIGLFAVNDFVTVSKEPEAHWDTLSPAIEAALRRVLAGG